jgi:predicted DNA-binding protein with PD1-like motif
MTEWHNYQSGRCFLGRLTGDEDLIQAVTALGVAEQVATAAVTITGRISQLTVGTFDPHQQVYVTRTEQRPMEIVACRGLLSTGGDRPFLHAHIVLADENTIIGGRLFSDTLAAEAECIIEELCGPPTVRRHDDRTGQLALTFHQTETESAGSSSGPPY